MSYIQNIKLSPTSGMNEVEAKRFNSLDPSTIPTQTGMAGADYFETIVPFNDFTCETVIKGKNDSYIVLGRDRYGNELEGKGPTGEAKCSMVDIVVGRWGGWFPEKDSNTDDNLLDPSFALDSARIYICQRTDVDEYFNIARDSSHNFVNRSAIAVKADNVRILSRESIKLVTKVDDKNSLNMDIANYGIDLIALNDDSDMQAIPKGKNLEQCIKRLTHHVRALNKVVKGFLTYQVKFNRAVQEHVHISPFWGDDTSPSIVLESIDGPSIIKELQEKTDTSLNKNMRNLNAFEMTYLEPSGAKYINSNFNRTN